MSKFIGNIYHNGNHQTYVVILKEYPITTGIILMHWISDEYPIGNKCTWSTYGSISVQCTPTPYLIDFGNLKLM